MGGEVDDELVGDGWAWVSIVRWRDVLVCCKLWALDLAEDVATAFALVLLARDTGREAGPSEVDD